MRLPLQPSRNLQQEQQQEQEEEQQEQQQQYQHNQRFFITTIYGYTYINKIAICDTCDSIVKTWFFVLKSIQCLICEEFDT